MIAIWIVLAVILLISAVFLGYFIYLGILISKISISVPFPKSKHEPSKQEEENVQFPSADKVILEGKWINAKEKSDKTVMFCHELGADMNSWHKYAEYLIESGFNIFTFNFRKMPAKHDGFDKLTAGQWATMKDTEDVVAAVNYLKKNRSEAAKKLGVLGVSKGANAALVATFKTKGINAVVTDGAFSTVETVVDYIKRWAPIFVPYKSLLEKTPNIVFQFLARFGLWIASKKLGCRFVSIEHSLMVAKVPIMFIHGEDDGYISPKHANYLFNLTNSVEELWVVPEAKHNDAVLVRPDEYKEKVVTFLEESLV